MLQRQSRLFLPTLREDPGDAEAVSHKLMVRAGLIRQLDGRKTLIVMSAGIPTGDRTGGRLYMRNDAQQLARNRVARQPGGARVRGRGCGRCRRTRARRGRTSSRRQHAAAVGRL